MAKRRGGSDFLLRAVVKVFLGLSGPLKIVVVLLAMAAGAVAAGVWYQRTHPGAFGPPAPPPAPVAPGTVVFMFWNVENLFDDRDDKRNRTDEPYDTWFARNTDDCKLKYDHLTEIVMRENGGNGPDVLACVEVESVRAAELLREALNAKIPAGAAKYDHVAMKELSANAGRYMAPCVISKIPLDAARTRLLGSHNLRVLETHVVANGADLCLVASHWTSQLSDDGTKKGGGRDKYATTIYAEYAKQMAADPAGDFLACGDFNTTPDSEPVVGELHMTGTRADVVPTATNPRLFGLLSGKPAAEFGTLFYQKPLIYDQIGVSPGMLDGAGWSCDPDSVRVPTDGMTRDRRTRRPWRFGNEKDHGPGGRGYADHFPVVVNLNLAAAP